MTQDCPYLSVSGIRLLLWVNYRAHEEYGPRGAILDGHKERMIHGYEERWLWPGRGDDASYSRCFRSFLVDVQDCAVLHITDECAFREHPGKIRRTWREGHAHAEGSQHIFERC